MKAKLEVGAELDIVSGEECHTGVRDLRGEIAAISSPTITRTFEASGTVAAAGTLDLVLGEAPTSRRFLLRSISICGQTPTTAVAGTAALYRGEGGNPNKYIDSTITLPDLGTWQDDQCVFRSGEQIVIRILGSTAGIGIFCAVTVVEETI